MNTPDIEEAREQFELAETLTDPTEKLDALEEGLALVEEILEDDAVADPDKARARNLRRTYLRRLLEQLMRLTNVQFSNWFGYMRLLLVEQRDVVEEILQADEALAEGYRAFIAMWSRQFREAMGQDIETFIRG